MEFDKPLPEEEQNLLFEKLKESNDPEAKEKLILHNLRLVHWVAKQYYKPGKNELDDIFQQGVIGLMAAVKNYNPDKGSFGNYAVLWIKQSITRDIANTAKIIRVPAYMVQEVNNLIRVKNQMIQEIGKEPSTWELSIRLNISIDRVNEIFNVVQEPISLNTIVSGEDESLTIEDSVIDENSMFEDDVIGNVFMQEVYNEFKPPKLTEEELKIVYLSCGLDGNDYTLKAIGEHYNLSVEQVRAKKSKALREMRNSKFMQQLRRDLDDRTSFYRSIDYSQPRSSGGLPSSPVERIVLEREKIKEKILMPGGKYE